MHIDDQFIVCSWPLHHAGTCFYNVEFCQHWVYSTKFVTLTTVPNSLPFFQAKLWNAMSKFIYQNIHFGHWQTGSRFGCSQPSLWYIYMPGNPPRPNLWPAQVTAYSLIAYISAKKILTPFPRTQPTVSKYRMQRHEYTILLLESSFGIVLSYSWRYQSWSMARWCPRHSSLTDSNDMQTNKKQIWQTKIYVTKWATSDLSPKPIFVSNSELHLCQQKHTITVT